jgi:hypothetical protein
MSGKPSINIPGIGDANVDQVNKGLKQFFMDDTEGMGNSSVRQAPVIPDGQDPAVTEAWRNFAYQHYVNQLVNQRGPKNEKLTREQAEKIANQTALAPGKVGSASEEKKPAGGGISEKPKIQGFPGSHYMGDSPQNAGGSLSSGRPGEQQSQQAVTGQIFGSPGDGKKLYAVMGEDGTAHGAYLTADQLKQAQQEGLNPEEIPQ